MYTFAWNNNHWPFSFLFLFILGPVGCGPISTKPALNFNQGLRFLSYKAFSLIIFSIVFLEYPIIKINYRQEELNWICFLTPCLPRTFLLYRYWWNTRIFPFTKKSNLHCTQSRYYFYLSRVRILVLPWNFSLLH